VVFLPVVREVLAVLFAVFLVEAGAEAPNSAEDKDVGEMFDLDAGEHALKQFAQRDDHADLHHGDEVLKVQIYVVERVFHVDLEEVLQVSAVRVFLEILLLNPRLDVGPPLVAV